MAVLQDININVYAQPSEKRLRSFLVLSQNENGRSINFRILGAPLPSNCSAMFYGTKPDGTVYSTTGTVAGNFVVVSEDIQMTAVAGVWDAKLDIMHGSHNIVTAVIRVAIEGDVVAPDAVPSDSQITGYVAQAKFYAEQSRIEAYGSPLTATLAADMLDRDRVYVYTGTESGMVQGNWYYWNGTAWTSGGVYNSAAVDTDTTISMPGKAADAAAVGAELSSLKEDLNKFYSIETETGKIFRFGESDGALKVVSNSAVTVGNQNILDTPLLNYNEHTDNGVTYQKQADGSIRISGTATANTNIWLNQTAKFPKGTYTLSGCPSGGFSSTYRMICNYRISGVDYTWLIDTGNGFTADLTEDIDNIRCAITIFSGATVDLTFYPQLEYASTKSEYATCANETASANTEISIDGIKTIFSDEAFGLTLFSYKWSGDISDVQSEIDAMGGRVDDLEESAEDVNRLLAENVQHFNIDDYSLVCVHHDNFSRTMTGWEIGMNAGGTDTGNNYEWVTAESYDDGLRVDEGAIFEANSSRTNPFSLRKIATDHADDFVIETNAPTTNNQVCFAFNVQNIQNMTYISARKQTNGYAFLIQDITNNSFGTTKYSASVANVLANVMRLCFHKQWLYIFLDDLLVASVFIGDVGSSLYLFSYKRIATHFDFVNIFNITNHKEWNPNYILDKGVADVPLIVTSANNGGYALQNVKTRWSDYADKFLLNSTDPLVHNGHRSERSVANLSGYTGNLRHLKISTDVYFPSTSVDTERTDIMMQMHDRDGTYRGFVPFILNFDNNKIKITLASTHAPKDGADDVLKWVEGTEIASINTDEWHRFELEIKERYDENQNPFVKVSIDSKLVFESKKPNCFNDLLGSSPQYGIYKNLWGTGVTTFERYFDNFKIIY